MFFFNYKTYIVLIIFFLLKVGIAQDQEKIDSLRNVIITAKHDTDIVLAYIEWADFYWYSNPDSAKKYYELCNKKIEQVLIENPNRKNIRFFKQRKATVINDIGLIAYNKGDAVTAIKNYTESISLQIEIGDKAGLAASYSNIGRLKYNNGNIAEALEYITKSLKLKDELGDKSGVSQVYNNLGAISQNQGDYTNALKYYQKSLKIKEELNDKKSIGPTLNNIGALYFKLAEEKKKSNNLSSIESLLDTSLNYFQKSLKIRQEISDKRGVAIVYSNIGDIYLFKGNIVKATDYFKISLAIQEKIGDKMRLANSLSKLARICKDNNDIKGFEKNVKRAYKISQELGYPIVIELTATLMKELSIIKGNYSDAYFYYNEEILMRDSLINEKNYKETQRQEAKYEYEKQAAIDSIAHSKLIEIKNIDIARIEEEKKAQSAQRNMLIVGFGLLLILAIFIFRSYIQKKKANELLASQKLEIIQKNKVLNTQSAELQELNKSLNLQNEEISKQHKAIEEKNEELKQLVEEVTSQRDTVENQKQKIEEIHHEVSQSIDYATRLQESILPKGKLIEEYISDHFVLFKPKDKVSGDFYWWTHIENHTVITAADCTGHGVPGAFMSMLGISFLREIVQKEYVTHTGVILRKLRKEIIKTLKQTGESLTQKDGMDMAIISINNETNILQYSGANNPLYIISDKEIQVIDEEIPTELKLLDNSKLKIESPKFFYEIRPDKMPIGIYEKMDKFKTHEIQLQKGDKLYMFSDGFADQFGGKRGKKFKYKQFKRLLIENTDMSMFELKTILNSTFENWRANNEQVDDVVIVGIEI